MNFSFQRILVTGATGFIGRHVVRALLEQNHRNVRGLVRDVAKAADLAKGGAEIFRGDLTDFASLQRAVKDCDIVIHTAAQVAAGPSRETFVQANLQGTKNLLLAAAEAGVRRFVHLSSIAVFGLAVSGKITDASPQQRSGDPYCDSKVDAEAVVFQGARESQMAVTILRPSAVYGPASTHWSVIPLKRLKKGKLFVVDGGKGLVNYVYVSNLVDAILLAAEDERAVGEAFIVNDGATTWNEFYSAYARMVRGGRIRSVPVWVAKAWIHYRNTLAALRGNAPRVPLSALNFLNGRVVYEQTHIENKLGHRPRVPLEEGQRRTEAWFRETHLL